MNRPTRRSLAAAAIIPAGFVASAQAQTALGNESTFERISRTRTLRIAALPGELPYFAKDLASGEWKGAAIEFAKDIAKVFDAKLEYVESTYANSVLDLQANKIDLAFAGADAAARPGHRLHPALPQPRLRLPGEEGA